MKGKTCFKTGMKLIISGLGACSTIIGIIIGLPMLIIGIFLASYGLIKMRRPIGETIKKVREIIVYGASLDKTNINKELVLNYTEKILDSVADNATNKVKYVKRSQSASIEKIKGNIMSGVGTSIDILNQDQFSKSIEESKYSNENIVTVDMENAKKE